MLHNLKNLEKVKIMKVSNSSDIYTVDLSTFNWFHECDQENKENSGQYEMKNFNISLKVIVFPLRFLSDKNNKCW